jgi:hypothetical protein
MDIVLWIASAILAVAYIFAGSNKAFRPNHKLTNLPWTQRFSAGTVNRTHPKQRSQPGRSCGSPGSPLPWPPAAAGRHHPDIG